MFFQKFHFSGIISGISGAQPVKNKLLIAIEVPLFANVVYDSFLMHIPTSVRPHSTPCRIGHFSTKITVYKRLDSKPECNI